MLSISVVSLYNYQVMFFSKLAVLLEEALEERLQNYWQAPKACLRKYVHWTEEMSQEVTLEG